MLTDFRFAFRALRTSPGFSSAVVLTLALGITVTSAVFSLANWLTLRPLPGVTHQERLVIIDFHRENNGGVSYPDLADLRARVTAFQDVGALGATVPLALHAEGGLPRYVNASLVSRDYFQVLGVPMPKGRWFTPDEEAAGGAGLAVVISDRLWKTAFGSEPNVLGTSLTLNGLPAVVVGVTPPSFQGTELLGDLDVWVPGTALWALSHIPRNREPSLTTRADKLFTHLVGRLTPGATMAQAGAQLRAVAAALAETYPKENASWSKVLPTISPADGVATGAREYVRRVLGVLMAAATLVLLLTCANVANLLLSRGVARRGEVAVRRALGGSRARLIRSQLAESLLLSAAAGAVGLLLAAWLVTLFHGMTLPGANPWMRNTGLSGVELDWRVVGFTELVAVLAGTVIGLLSGAAGTRGDLLLSLRGSGAAGVVGRGRLHGTLVGFQLAISVALLVTALLLVRTARNLGRMPVGFDADRVTSFAIWPPFSGYTTGQSQTILRRATEAVRSLPGIEAAALSAYAPFSTTIGDEVRQEGAAASDPAAPAISAWVGPGYFETMGIRLLAGRGFTEAEAFLPVQHGSDNPAVVSASHARILFGTLDPVGRLVQNQNASLTYRIIGVVPDTRWAGLLPGSESSPLYQPLLSFVGGGVILVRSRLPLSQLRPAVERAVAAVAPAVPLFDEERLSDKVARSVAEPLLLAGILPAFTAIALLLAGLGLYAVVTFSVTQRLREMGIRIALGARAGQIIALVLRQAAVLGGVGLVVGLGGSVALVRVVASQLYGVSPRDPASYLVASVLLLAMVIAASVIPARRATRVDPVEALRHE